MVAKVNARHKTLHPNSLPLYRCGCHSIDLATNILNPTIWYEKVLMLVWWEHFTSKKYQIWYPANCLLMSYAMVRWHHIITFFILSTDQTSTVFGGIFRIFTNSKVTVILLSFWKYIRMWQRNVQSTSPKYGICPITKIIVQHQSTKFKTQWTTGQDSRDDKRS